jgi:hypothetical protein
VRQRAGVFLISPCPREEGASEKESDQGRQTQSRDRSAARQGWKRTIRPLIGSVEQTLVSTDPGLEEA